MRVATRCLDRGEEHLAIEGDTLVTQELVIRKMTKSGWVKTYPPPQGDYDERIEKMEKALSQEMARTREMDDILAGVVKRVGYVGEVTASMPAAITTHVAGSSRWEIKSGTNDGGIAFINIDPKASPTGIPFSVALEYLKAARSLRHPSFEDGNYIQVLSNSIVMCWPEDGKWTNFVMDSALALSDAWTVLPEPQKS
jgi:hypothetical protein